MLLLAACATTNLDSLTPEQRYDALLKEDSREVLRRHLQSDEPLTRNAAARRLCELGEPQAADALIANLHRESRTFVATDAIHHLKAAFGTDRGYDPNLGYRHQTDKQNEWWDWWGKQAFGAKADRAPIPDPHAHLVELAQVVREQLDYWKDVDRTRDLWSKPIREPEVKENWAELAERFGKSRNPREIALLERCFENFLYVLPKNADLWNNHALLALNNSQWETSEKSYRRALELAPNDPGLHNDIGILLEGLGRLQEAGEHYGAATRLKSDDDIAWANLGDVLRAQGRTEAAIAAYRNAERLAPEKWYYHRLWIGRLVADKP